ncbi:MAG: stage V sporulation protein AD [Lachnospiraceae bacterium]|nr:stage V sporulation protein AD [Lachnospiraceae bacterium]
MDKNNSCIGLQSLVFNNPAYIQEYYSIAGKKEGEGPLGKYFSHIESDDMFGSNTWEEAESSLQAETVQCLLHKAKLEPSDLRYAFAGDLLGQLMATSFGLESYNVPLFGLYGACSTMGEAISLASMTVSAGYADKVLALASSHYASAEKTFRFPLGYGSQTKSCATRTVTGCGAVIISADKGIAKITGLTTGKIVDYGIKEKDNMGACMAPAAADTIFHNLTDFGRSPEHYDKIITGDLGYVGQSVLFDLLKVKGYDISKVHMDCGIEIFDSSNQHTNSGGSGCGCSASTLCGYILDQIKERKWRRILFVPTGALVSPVSFNEGNSIPGIAHGVIIEAV